MKIRIPRIKLSTFLFISFLAVVLTYAVTVWIGSNIVLHPKRRPLEERHILVRENPANYGLTLERFEAPTRDGLKLKGFLVYPSPELGEAIRTRRMLSRLEKAGMERSKQIRGTVILLHGRGGIKDNMLTIAQRFVAADFRCIVYDARAHSESEGTFCTYGKKERYDLGSVLDFVEEELGRRGEELGPVFAFGNSLGAAVSLQSIPEESRIIGGVMVAPFADLREEIIHAIGNATSVKLPRFVRASIFQVACWRGGIDPLDIRPEISAKSIRIPLFLVHGERDQVIPIAHARRIFKNLSGNDHRWKEIPGAYHRNVLAEGGDELYEEMIHFYLRCISEKQDLRTGTEWYSG